MFTLHQNPEKDMLLAANKRVQSRKEELFNGISHGLGLVAAILAMPFLIIEAIHVGDAGFLVGVTVFCSTVILLYLTSTIYHLLTREKVKRVFRVFDHSAIFLLIAGTYTPFTLGVFKGALGWSFFGIIWGIAAIGIAMKIVFKAQYPIVSTMLYLLMGWIIIFALKPLVALVPPLGIAWLVAGGVFYTLGVAFYAFDSQFRYSHFIWHLFVMAGTFCHYFAVYGYAY